MAQYDIAITQQQYDRLVQDFEALDGMLAPLIPVMIRLAATEDGKAKLKHLIKTHEGARWIRLWVVTARKWRDWLDSIEGVTE